MKRLITALAAGVAALAASAGTALAGGPVQSVTQSSSTGQGATAASSATQVQPSNQNISVRILSPGDNGDVTQSNGVSSAATATNTASTTQSADQALSSQCGCAIAPTASDALSGALAADPQAASAVDSSTPAAAPTGTSQSNGASSDGTSTNAAPTTQTGSQSGSGGGVQSTQQNASTEQGAQAASSAEQDHPSNSNVSVRILSPGDNGDVTQSNGVSSTAGATNSATTGQTSSQNGGGSGVQSAIQNAGTEQEANAASSAKQVDPSNSNVSVRILSKGDDGDVTQSNGVSSSATAQNTAPTTQKATQTEDGPSCGCEGSAPSVQAIGQSSWTGQNAYGASSATQVGASNTNYPVRIGSYGDSGDVTQSNGVSSTATATNTAPVTQSAYQDPRDGSCGCHGAPAIQAIGQDSTIKQWGTAKSSAEQFGASNTDDPVRIGSGGDGGSVTQSNGVSSAATATNSAPVYQTATQALSGSGIQAIGQKSFIWQGADAESSALQKWEPSHCGCGGSSAGNSAAPVRIGSYGDDGSLTQANGVSSTATAANTAAPTQKGSQYESAPKCGCGGLGIQAIGQDSWIGQLAKAMSSAAQFGAANSSDPVRLWSYGDGGDTSQANGASSAANAPNWATLAQEGGQRML
jgi:hypothetical protein